MQLTRAGVSYNLHKSPHLLEMDYGETKVIFHFSSQTYMVKFNSRCGENRESINNSLTKRFGFNVKADILADLKLYAWFKLGVNTYTPTLFLSIICS